MQRSKAVPVNADIHFAICTVERCLTTGPNHSNRLLVVVVDTLEDTNAEVREPLERSLGEVDMTGLATGALVDHNDIDKLALVYRAVHHEEKKHE